MARCTLSPYFLERVEELSRINFDRTTRDSWLGRATREYFGHVASHDKPREEAARAAYVLGVYHSRYCKSGFLNDPTATLRTPSWVRDRRNAADLELAQKWLKRAVELGAADAHHILGCIQAERLQEPGRRQRAVDHFRAATLGGNQQAPVTWLREIVGPFPKKEAPTFEVATLFYQTHKSQAPRDAFLRATFGQHGVLGWNDFARDLMDRHLSTKYPSAESSITAKLWAGLRRLAPSAPSAAHLA